MAFFRNIISYVEPYLVFPDIIINILDIAILTFLIYTLLKYITRSTAEQDRKGPSASAALYLADGHYRAFYVKLGVEKYPQRRGNCPCSAFSAGAAQNAGKVWKVVLFGFRYIKNNAFGSGKIGGQHCGSCTAAF